MAPTTHYAHHGSVAIAWADAGGDAPLDLLFLPGLISHVEHAWEEPGLAAFFGRLGTFARLIVMDRRGTGLSDPLNPECTLDDEVGDVLAVLDAARSERAVLLGYTTGGTLAVRCAAEQPERVRALVLYASTARSLFAPDYDWAFGTQPSWAPGCWPQQSSRSALFRRTRNSAQKGTRHEAVHHRDRARPLDQGHGSLGRH